MGAAAAEVCYFLYEDLFPSPNENTAKRGAV